MTRIFQKSELIIAIFFVPMIFSSVMGCGSAGLSSPKGSKSSDGNFSRAITSDRVELPIIVSSRVRQAIPKGTRIVISHIEDKERVGSFAPNKGTHGECANAVRDALLVRLADNTDYIVLARDDLESMLFEKDLQWSGPFNTRTSTKLGELLGASVFVVGRVAYCGQSIGTDSGDKFGDQFSISVILQIIDLTTGRVVLSSASEGVYDPGPNSFLQDILPGIDSSSWRTAIRDLTKTGLGAYAANQSPWSSSSSTVDPLVGLLTPKEQVDNEAKAKFAILEASKDMANAFADKFFARPSWETVFMWRSGWQFGESVRLVQLGYCSRAVELLEGPASDELSMMSDSDVAQYLLNYGVALLCSNRPEEAFEKLRASHRVDPSQTTLEMIGLAAKLIEWDLHVEPNDQPEVELLAKRQSKRPMVPDGPIVRVTEEPTRETVVPEVEILQRDVGEAGTSDGSN